jgi:cytochrome b pre-mRNA-processing protein 3
MAKWLQQLFGTGDDRGAQRPLYQSVVAIAREPHWYIAGEVADTTEGRFEMVTLILSLVMIRLEALGEMALATSALLAELFVEDMDGQLRESGVGDVGVGKHIGNMMSALGGRLGAYREALAGSASLEAALGRNLYAAAHPSDAAMTFVRDQLLALKAQLDVMSFDQLQQGIGTR